jgi:threonyl-tRNA synthetase
MQNKIRLAQEQKVPYMLVLGDREVEARPSQSASLGRAGERRRGMLIDQLAEETAARRP